MLSTRLVRMIEDHAEDLTREALDDIATNRRTAGYHSLSRHELQRRVYDVYRNLGRWLGDESETRIESTYGELGRSRRGEGIPLSQVVFALMLTKGHLWSFIRSAGLVGSAVDLYQEEELTLLLSRFFDKAIYHTVRGYESVEAARR